MAKTFIEKMFGMMMPRGTTRLGLSRMNMGGAGAKMIRGIFRFTAHSRDACACIHTSAHLIF